MPASSQRRVSAATWESIRRVSSKAILASLVASWKCAAASISPLRVFIRQSASRLAIRPLESSTIGW